MINETPIAIEAPARTERCPLCGGRKSLAARQCIRCTIGASPRGTWGVSSAQLPADVPAGERPRQTATYRLNCVSCGRSVAVDRPPADPGRCLVCGGTRLSEMEPS